MNKRLIKKTNILGISIISILLYISSAEAEYKDCSTFSDEAVVIAAFFPGNSTFSHSRIKSSINRKKKKSKKIERRNRSFFNRFTETESHLLGAFKKKDSLNRLHLNWQLGYVIAREEKRMKNNKAYYPFFIKELSKRLDISKNDIEKMKILYHTFPVIARIPDYLSCEHIDILLDIRDDKEREFFSKHILQKSLSSEELKKLIKKGPNKAGVNED